MKMEFPETVAACRIVENGQWAIGDALIKECGPPGESGSRSGAYDKLADASIVVAANGYQYTEAALRNFRTVAHAFPPARRLSGISFSCHDEAGNPERLQQVLAALKLPKGEKLTRRLLRETLDSFVADEKARKAAENAKLTKQIEADTARRDKAIETLKTAKDEDSKVAARKEIDKIEKSIDKARTERTKVTVMPTRNTTVIVPERLSTAIPYLEISSTIGTAMISLRRAEKMIKEHGPKLDATGIAALIEMCLGVADAANKTVDLLRGTGTPAKAHLSVVGE